MRWKEFKLISTRRVQIETPSRVHLTQLRMADEENKQMLTEIREKKLSMLFVRTYGN